MKRKHLILATVCLVMTSCSTNSQQATTSQEPVTTPVDVQEEVVSEVKPEVKELPSNSLTATGKVKAANYTDLYFRSQEQIAHVYVKNGARVGKGQKLADLEVFALNSQLRQAEISLEQAKLELQDILIGQGYDPDHLDKVPADMMKLAKVKSGYEQAALQKENALREIENATLVAPFDGVIANLTAKPHHMAGSSEPFCRIIQTSNMEVEFQVLENELHLIKMGQKVEIVPQATTVGVQQGEICSMNPLVDEKGLIQVRARVKGNVGLMEGMNVTVRIQS
ncbi:MAG: efflux RND transporter periplasmic adaptor subunit [Bacteroides sp.]|nr:efflux RND transporter periplasmic adaptor subunit [Bacteroides sp.]